MRTISEQELKDILDKHSKWLNNQKGGERADLRNANLHYANLRNANLRNANLSDANLRNANLRYADLSYADLSDANLRYANLSSADLRNANLHYADLRNANLRYANLSNANLSSTPLENNILMTFMFRRHTAFYLGDDKLTIGCETHTLINWLKNFNTIGKNNRYTTKEIEHYGRFIKGCIKAYNLTKGNNK